MWMSPAWRKSDVNGRHHSPAATDGPKSPPAARSSAAVGDRGEAPSKTSTTKPAAMRATSVGVTQACGVRLAR